MVQMATSKILLPLMVAVAVVVVVVVVVRCDRNSYLVHEKVVWSVSVVVSGPWLELSCRCRLFDDLTCVRAHTCNVGTRPVQWGTRPFPY